MNTRYGRSDRIEFETKFAVMIAERKAEIAEEKAKQKEDAE